MEKRVGLVPIFPWESCLYVVCVCSQNTLAKNITLKCELIFSASFQMLLEISLKLRHQNVSRLIPELLADKSMCLLSVAAGSF